MSASAKSPETKDARAERLAAALRENLKRRKAQAREKSREQARARVPTKDSKQEAG